MRAVAALLVLVLLGTGGAVAQGAAAAQGSVGRRVALVVGNGGYRHVPALPNAASDARLIAETLRAQGFELVGGGVQQDLDRAGLGGAVQAFGRALAGAEIGLFYYAGHGLQVQGVNWLVPVDANPSRPQDLDFQMVDANLVLRQMEAAGTRLNLLLLDACRNNPFLRTGLRATGSGLAEMRAPEGTLISYATQPGAVAADGPEGGNGPYAAALAGAMKQPETDIFRLFNQVGLQVKRSTAGAQQPWVSNSPIEGDLRFGGGPAVVAMVVPPVVAVAPAAPGPAPGPVPDPLRAVLAETRCSLLELRDGEGGTRITGLAPPGFDMAALLRQMGGTRAVRVVEGEVRVLPGFACPVVELLGPAVRGSRGVLASPARRQVVAGQALAIGLAPARALRVDLYERDVVRHLPARSSFGRVTIPAEVLAQPGVRLLTAVSSAARLALGERPEVEGAEGYLAALRGALEGVGGVEAGVVLLDVRAGRVGVVAGAPVGGAPGGGAPGGGASGGGASGRCGAVLERAQLGEALSEADRGVLRGCR